MSLLSSLLNAFGVVPKSTLPHMPAIQQSKFAKALVSSNRKHVVRTNRGGPHNGQPFGVDVFNIDHRALERNKYAPWGRGHASGLS